MKLLIASDLHGSAYYVEKLIEKYRESGAERLLTLGDLLYHGPRNDLPRDYDTKLTAKLLNGIADELICIKGNCEADVDQMVLDFPVLTESGCLYEQGHVIWLTHGHVFNMQNPPKMKKGDILLHGHTHVPAIVHFGGESGKDFTYLNPGSVSIPKENSHHSYMIMDGGRFTWYDLETGEPYMYFDI